MALLPVSKVCGASVSDADGQTLGQIIEVMIDDADGSIAYVALSHGGTLGLGETLFAVPWEALSVSEEGYRLSMAKAVLEGARGFDKDAWPTAPDPLFR